VTPPRPGFIHPTAEIGNPPEHRDWAKQQVEHFPQIHSTAQVNAFVTVDAGYKDPTRIGARSFAMAHCHLGHDCQIGEDVELAPHCSVGGHVEIGNGVRVGQGALFKPFVKVGDGARIGMGAVVVKDVPAGETWVGNPAKKLEKKVATGPVLTDDELEAWERLAEACNH
jgi:acyl-[acyl carrier protein]--UDP-N-acetylglucosamine O-acyltransferase